MAGMHCAACSSRIERVVGAMPGVSSIAVNLADESARLTFDQARLSLDAIAARVAALGFTLGQPAPTQTTLHLAIGGMVL